MREKKSKMSKVEVEVERSRKINKKTLCKFVEGRKAA